MAITAIGKFASFLDWISQVLPLQTRRERWRNELDLLEKEKEKLLHEIATIKKVDRLCDVIVRIERINKLMRNAE